ncbi:MAG: MlaD family protein [Geoalkalibacter sp.]|uniref:MlaD family protein n=1 Tax=Geoalkalibacter sp. TaxID=3041440 RepID=UPI003D0A7863
MSAKTGKAIIGAFVLGALCLAVAGVVLFGSGRLFSPQKKYVMYFDSSVKGLSVGAPVLFRGVKIGFVSDILIQGDMQEMIFRVPVIAEIDLSRFQFADEKDPSPEFHQSLIDRGLRAQMQIQSLVTGQLMINLDFYSDRPARFVSGTTELPQIPTIPSTTAELAQKLEELPLQQLVEGTNRLIGGMERLVNDDDMQQMPRNLNLAVAAARDLMAKLDREVGLLSAEARKTIRAATATLEQADRVLTFEEGLTGELADNLNQTLAQARQSLNTLDQTLEAVQERAADEQSRYQLRHALSELGNAARNLGDLVEYLGRHPEALLRGKIDLKEK